MRSTTGPGIEFLSPAVSISCRISAGLTDRESHLAQSKAGQGSLDPTPACQGLVGGPFLKGSLAPPVASVGHLHTAQGSVTETPVHFGIHSRNDNRLLEDLTRPCRPRDSGCWGDFLSSDSSKSLIPSLDAFWSKGLRGLKIEKPPASRELNGLPDLPALPGSQDTFTSSFSFIRLSLGATGERGEAEGCLPSREIEPLHQSPQQMAAEASCSEGPHEDPRHLWTFSHQATPGLVDLAQVAGSSGKPECGGGGGGVVVSSPDTGFNPQDPSSAGGQGGQGVAWDTRGWQALLKEWEPVLQEYLRNNCRQLEVCDLRESVTQLSAGWRLGAGS